jgi:hypothetical protein
VFIQSFRLLYFSGSLRDIEASLLANSIPAFIRISDGKLHDVNTPDLPAFEAGTSYIMDHDCVNFAVKTEVCCAVVT